MAQKAGKNGVFNERRFCLHFKNKYAILVGDKTSAPNKKIKCKILLLQHA